MPKIGNEEVDSYDVVVKLFPFMYHEKGKPLTEEEIKQYVKEDIADLLIDAEIESIEKTT